MEPELKLDAANCRIWLGDCHGLPGVGNGTVDAIITTPPFNIGHPYAEYDDKISDGDYLALLDSVFVRGLEVLKSGGLFAIEVADCLFYQGTLWFYASYVERRMLSLGYEAVHRMLHVDARGHKAPLGVEPEADERGRLTVEGHTHLYWMLVFAKPGAPAPAVSLPEIIHTPDFRHPLHHAAWPDDYVETLAAALVQPGAVVLDPFMGLGRIGIATCLNGGTFIGYDRVAAYCRDYIMNFETNVPLNHLERRL